MIAISENIQTLVSKNRKPMPCRSNRASALGDPCIRKLVYMRTAWDKALPPSESLAGIFETGNRLESVIERILSEAGQSANPRWRIVGAQISIKDNLLEQYEISGHIDGILQTEESGQWDNLAVVDIKTSSPHVFASLDGIESLEKYPWTAKYIAQLSIYALGLNLEKCCLIFIDKSNLFSAKTILWDLDYGYAEELLAKAKAINKHVNEGTLPDKINRPDICGRCEFAAYCMPELAGTGNMIINDDSELADMLQRRGELEPAKKEFDAIESTLKKRLVEGQDIICGQFAIEWQQKERKAYQVPAANYWQKKITHLGNGEKTDN